jgi:hypothetical protein
MSIRNIVESKVHLIVGSIVGSIVVFGPTIVYTGVDGCLVFASYNMVLTGEGP